MKTKPEHLPALPDGAVYLGKGGEFKTPECFAGWRCGAISPWDFFDSWAGDNENSHYCAPADSEIVRINTPQVANLTDTDECPKDPPAGWVRVTVGKVQKHDWIRYDNFGYTSTDWAKRFVGASLSDPFLRYVYRHPDRFNTPTRPAAEDPLDDLAPATDPLALVLTPIQRTDEQSAEAYLRWLRDSPYHHSLDDDPTECPGINPHVAPHLRDRAAECITALGYNRAWAVFSG